MREGVGKWAEEFLKTGFEKLVGPPMQEFMNENPLFTGIAAVAAIVGVIVAIRVSRKKAV